ncbi:hypothetical protein B0P06_005822 [Clostridium saccharoperbutylacetonicum]|uniref:hypothetical protein n=1 Tax=Clostridium saccharoperbutylacetonicum TaxID=36745 RepID=UPI0003485453|nr:hypothetical protein [Clostridium saccharoperbutylacetonicum]NSB46051.1 hypothetical protein [Clostridium saccharoperbutylacetonicum]
MMDKSFIETLDSFKKFMLSNNVPNYVVRYCVQLNKIIEYVLSEDYEEYKEKLKVQI